MSFLTGQFSYVICATAAPNLEHQAKLLPGSENQFQTELNLAHLRGRGCNSSYVGIQSPHRILKDIIVRRTKVRMVQEVEKFCTKLEVLSLPHRIVLCERKIQIDLSEIG